MICEQSQRTQSLRFLFSGLCAYSPAILQGRLIRLLYHFWAQSSSPVHPGPQNRSGRTHLALCPFPPVSYSFQTELNKAQVIDIGTCASSHNICKFQFIYLEHL